MPRPGIDTLVLDSNPLITQQPLRGLARRFVTTPNVIAELRDPKAREHWERLKLLQDVEVLLREPSAIALSKATTFARKTGDYAVLSRTDMCILALTLELHEMADANAVSRVQKPVPGTGSSAEMSQAPPSATSETAPAVRDSEANVPEYLSSSDSPSSPIRTTATVVTTESLAERLKRLALDTTPQAKAVSEEYRTRTPSSEPPDFEDPPEIAREPLWDSSAEPPSNDSSDEAAGLYEDPLSEDDGEGEWITPANVSKHRARAKGAELVPAQSAPTEVLNVACMTSDFAMQNVLLHSGLNLVSSDGKKIDKVKTWVLRCHACFKLCKDPSKKFCPSCGGATLIRAAVTVEAADSARPGSQPALKVHLKKNFQYRLRGTNASLPPPRMGQARGGGKPAIVLREDQVEWQRAAARDRRNIEKEEKRTTRALEEKSKRGSEGVWMDQDWIPDLLVGGGGPGTTYPKIGYNPRSASHRKK